LAWTLYEGDCLEVMKTLPEGSIDMILCDPPYGTVKGLSLDGWENQTTEWDTAIQPEVMFENANRVLRMNGALVLFSQEPYTSRLITEAHNNLPFSYRCIWLKDHFANSLSCKKAPVSYFEDIVFFFKKYDTLAQHPLREYALKVINFIGLTLKEINSQLGHRKAEHFFYVDTTQFGLCTKPVYDELTLKYGLNTQEWFLSYEKLETINRRFNRRFNLEGKKFKSNVLSFKKDYGGLHPTQKPVALFEYLIRTYTNEGDTVLDNCAGSGTTAVAAENCGRNSILIEKEPKYCNIIRERMNALQGRLALQGRG